MAASSSGGFLMKTGVFAALAAIAFFLFQFFGGTKNEGSAVPSSPKVERPVDPTAPKPSKPVFEIQPSDPSIYEPSRSQGCQLVRHEWFSLSYSEEHEQAEWVAYELTKERLNALWADRPDTFRPDPDVKTESATPNDYRASGYDRGHLCPAADMAFDARAIDETFYMSNMSPQVKAFNVGIWRELEESTRDWARRNGHIFVITGPVLKAKPLGQIGFSKVTAPSQFFKVIMAGDKGIGFIVPNEKSDKPLLDFAVSIDRVEEATGLDFFPKLLTGLNEEAESKLDRSAWKTDAERYRRRISVWNQDR